jgi:hypothetical protein
MKRSFHIFLIAAIFSLVSALPLISAGSLCGKEMTKKQLTAQLLGKTQKEVVGLMGEPKDTAEGPNILWAYEAAATDCKITLKDEVSGQETRYIDVWFNHKSKKVVKVTYLNAG